MMTREEVPAHLLRMHDIYLTPDPDPAHCIRKCVAPEITVADGAETHVSHRIIMGTTALGNPSKRRQNIIVADPDKVAAPVEAIGAPALQGGLVILEAELHMRDPGNRKIYRVVGMTKATGIRLEHWFVGICRDGNPMHARTVRGLAQMMRSYQQDFDVDWKGFQYDDRYLGKWPELHLRCNWKLTDMVVTNATDEKTGGGVLHIYGHATQQMSTGRHIETPGGKYGWNYETIPVARRFRRRVIQSYEGIWLPVHSHCDPAETPKLYEAALQFDRDAAAFVPDEDMEALAMLA